MEAAQFHDLEVPKRGARLLLTNNRDQAVSTHCGNRGKRKQHFTFQHLKKLKGFKMHVKKERERQLFSYRCALCFTKCPHVSGGSHHCTHCMSQRKLWVPLTNFKLKPKQ